MDKQQIDDFAARYRKVNGNFTKKLVFSAGIDAGFFAEFKYMVNAVVYCLQNKIQFCLYSRGANFGKGGWSEFSNLFAPKWKETSTAAGMCTAFRRSASYAVATRT